jgi:LAO/AO transport system kinase
LTHPDDGEVERLVDGLATGSRAAVSEALNLVDDRRPEQRERALDLLDRVSDLPGAAKARRVGLTGAPGVGKSTLLNALVAELRDRDQRIGIIAVDPSSRRSGGALLGDRMRLASSAREQGVFLRSMAARDRLGGLADATQAGTCVMSAVFDWVFVETVGVGQSETEIAQLVDTLVFVAQPGAGDLLQFMKAGLLELPDIFVINKADTGAAAERTRRELLAGLGLSGRAASTGWTPPVLLASARDRTGTRALVETIDAHREAIGASGELARRRAAGAVAFAIESLVRRYGEYGLERIGGVSAVERRLSAPAAHSPFRVVLEIGHEIEAALGGR